MQSLTSQRNGSYRGHAICWRSDISIHQVAPQREMRDRDSKRDRTKKKEEDVPWHKSGGEFLRSRRILLTFEWGASVQKHFHVQTNKQLRKEALWMGIIRILVWFLIALNDSSSLTILQLMILQYFWGRTCGNKKFSSYCSYSAVATRWDI